MRNFNLGLGLAGSLLALGVAKATAADVVTLPPPPEVIPVQDAGPLFGNMRFAIDGRYQQNSAVTNTWPAVNLGEKFSYEPANSPFGLQANLNADGFLYALESNGPPASGGRLDTVAALHGTYAIDGSTKLGIYASLTDQAHNLIGITSTTYSYGGRSNLSAATFTRNDAVVGLEGMYLFQPTAWVEGHLGLTNTLGWGRSWTDATSGAYTTAGTVSPQPLGFQVGGDIRYGLNPNLSLRADVNYNFINMNAGFDQNLSAYATAQYAFDDSPFAAFTQAGLLYDVNDGGSYTEYIGKVGLIYSFGGGTETTRGKLFHVAGTTGTID